MTDRHLTPPMLEGLRTKQLRGPELVDALRHLGGCPECSQRALASTGVTKLTPLQFDENDAVSIGADRRTRRRRTFAWAAAAALVVLVSSIAFFLAGRTPATKPNQATTTTTPPPPRKTPEPRQPAQPARPARWESLVAAAVTTGRLPYPSALAELSAPPDVLRGGTATAGGELVPRGVVVDDVRPRFTWPVARGATYVVSIFDGDRRVAVSPALESNEWRPSAELARGRTYAWQVEVVAAGSETLLPPPEDPPALFKIASREDHEAIRDARTTLPDDHLLHAVLYARAGLRSEAEQALQRARANGQRGAASIQR